MRKRNRKIVEIVEIWKKNYLVVEEITIKEMEIGRSMTFNSL